MASARQPITHEHGQKDAIDDKYHPLFHSTDADVRLRSSDGVLFRVHSYTLSTTSGLFSTMFSLPQPSSLIETPSSTTGPQPSSSQCTDTPEEDREKVEHIIPTHETSDILALLLLMISGLPLPQPLSHMAYEDVERVLTLAESWDAPGPTSAIRAAITSPAFIERDPLRMYALASHFGWQQERRLASSYVLALDLFDDSEEKSDECVLAGKSTNMQTLDRLASEDLMALLKLRRRRGDLFRDLLDSQERFSAGNTENFQCTYCGVTRIDNTTWRALKHALNMEMDRWPLGDGITGRDVHGIGGARGLGMIGWAETERCWEAKCPKEGCKGPNYDRITTLKQIRRCIEALPIHVDDQTI